ncbi:hypothetical protein V2J09_003961 [Rumex salicifolius]
MEKKKSEMDDQKIIADEQASEEGTFRRWCKYVFTKISVLATTICAKQMQLKVLTVCFGGEWKMKDDYCAYVGDLISKAFVIEDNMQLDVVRNMIMERFNIIPTPDISLTHLHPFQKLKNPYMVDTEEDFQSFLDINEASQVSWTLPLYVSLSRKMSENKPLTDAAQNSIVRLQSDESFQGAVVEVNSVNVDRNQIEVVQSSEEDEGNHQALTIGTDFLHVGQIFKSKHELITAVKIVAIRESFGYRVYKSTPELYRLKCVDAKCTWKMRATKLKSTDYFEIRRFNDQHTCPYDVRCAKPCQPTYQFVAEKILARYEGVSKGPNPKMIRSDMQNEFDQDVSYWKAWKAHEWAKNLIRGTPEENYAMLPAYCHMLKQVNNGTYTCLEIDNYNRFKSVFISFGASIRAFHLLRKNICSINAEVGKYLCDAKFHKWSRVHCASNRYNIMAINESESIDSILKESRSYPIVALFEYITDLLSRWFNECREEAEKNNKQLPPNLEKVLEARCKYSTRYDVKMLNNDQFEVVGGKFSGVVDLSQKTCSCKVFDLDRIPCAHAIAAIQHSKCEMIDFVGEYYQCHSWYKTYQETIHQVPKKSDWEVPEDVINIECSPPLVERKSGRPGKRRFSSVKESTSNSAVRKAIKCSNCGNSGHNRTTCPNKSSTSSSSSIMQLE